MQRLTIRLKGCPRCGGDLFPEYDLAGTDLVCLQCGYIRPVCVRDPAGEQGRNGPASAATTDSPSDVAA